MKTIPSVYRSARGPGEAAHYKLDAAEIGGFEFELPISYHDNWALGLVFDGVVGDQFLMRFKLIIDYARDRVIFEPNEKLQEPIRHYPSGMMLQANGDDFDKISVFFVYEASFAARAGIQKGDELVSVNGQSAAKLTLPSIWRMFHGPVGESFEVVVRRGAETFKRTITLSDYLK